MAYSTVNLVFKQDNLNVCALRSMFTMYYLLVCIMYVDTHIYISNPDVNAVPPGKIHRANEVRQGVP